MTHPALFRRQPALAAAVSLIFCAAASAQSTSTASATQTVLVTATRTVQAASDIISDHDTISAEEIALSGHSSLAELLQKRRGIEITTNGGPGSNASVFIRGADTKQNVVLVDGVRVGASTTGGATWSTIPLSQIDHIEIVYGPLSSLYGADAIGGVIQVFTKQGGAYLSPTVSKGFGAKGARVTDAGIAGSSAGAHALRFALRVGQEKADGISASKPGAGAFTYNADRDGYNRDSASGQVSLKLAAGHEVGASFLQSRLSSQFDAGPDFDDSSVEKLENFALHSKNQFIKNWHSQVQLSRSLDKSTAEASYGNSRFDTTRTSFSWQNDIGIGTDLLQLVYEHHKEEVGSSEAALNRARSTNSYAAAYQLKRGAYLGTASLRNDNNSQYGSETTGSLAFAYRFNSNWRASVSGGTSFRAPAFNELYFPDFGIASNRSERGRNSEAGVVFDDGQSTFSASYYRNRITDLLVYAPVCPVEQDTHAFGCAYNINSAQLSGLSLGGSATLRHFTVRAALDLQDPQDATTGKRLARRATKHGSIALEYAAGRYKGGVESVFSDQRFDDAANLDALAGYGLLNFYGSMALNRNWSLFGRWNNALNKDYELARNYATPGGNLFVGLRYGVK
jgi:vitamin B12 transporter